MFACAETGRCCSNLPARRSEGGLAVFQGECEKEKVRITGPDTTRDGITNGSSDRVASCKECGDGSNIFEIMLVFFPLLGSLGNKLLTLMLDSSLYSDRNDIQETCSNTKDHLAHD